MSWEQLVSIYREAEDTFRAEQDEPPTACPNDGQPLKASPYGGLFCVSDGYRWPE